MKWWQLKKRSADLERELRSDPRPALPHRYHPSRPQSLRHSRRRIEQGPQRDQLATDLQPLRRSRPLWFSRCVTTTRPTPSTILHALRDQQPVTDRRLFLLSEEFASVHRCLPRRGRLGRMGLLSRQRSPPLRQSTGEPPPAEDGPQVSGPKHKSRKPPRTPRKPTLMAHKALKAHTSTRSSTKQPAADRDLIVDSRRAIVGLRPSFLGPRTPHPNRGGCCERGAPVRFPPVSLRDGLLRNSLRNTYIAG